MKFRRFAALGLGSLAIVFGALFFAYSWVNGPVSVTPKQSSVQQVVSDPKPAYKELSGKYFSTTILDTLSVRSQNVEPQGIRLEQLLAVSQGSQSSSRLAISIGTLPGEGLSGISDVQYRIGNTDLYKTIITPSAPQGSLSFSNSEASEVSIFWPYLGKYAGVVITGTSSSQQILEEELSRVVSQWQWK